MLKKLTITAIAFTALALPQAFALPVVPEAGISIGAGTKEQYAEAKVLPRTTIGYKRILRLPTVTAKEVRLTVEEAKACPLISNLQLFCAPDVPASSGGTVAALPAAVPSGNAVL